MVRPRASQSEGSVASDLVLYVSGNAKNLARAGIAKLLSLWAKDRMPTACARSMQDLL
jgi:hypothetical protein